MLRLVAEQAIRYGGCLRAVGGAQFLQDVPDMHLYGAFLHFQFGRDQLVGPALTQEVEYTKLAWRQVQLVRQPSPLALGMAIGLFARRAQRVRRDEGSSGTDEPESGEGNF